MQPTLTLHQISYQQRGSTLLDSLSVSVSQGEVLGLLGVNGAGKSTTLKIAAGLLLPTQGNVAYASDTRLGYVPETPPLLASWTVEAFLNHVYTLHRLSKTKRQQTINRVVEQCHLTAILPKPITTLSKGNRQRLALAQAIIHQPNLLLLDEPTSGLDPQQISEFRTLIESIKATTAVILSSHIMQELTGLCDRLAIIHHGQKQREMILGEQQPIIMIKFNTAVATEVVKNLTTWQSGKGKYHYFRVNNDTQQQQLIQQLLDKSLSIQRISGAERIIEQQFLHLIGHSNEDNVVVDD